ncbi:MAG: nucleotidyltransferase domain-containing protein [candidate division KSB1 bacterium]|nr:nucleotidyltransferase domain-containing protein [candidate division KSB1 bacterium]
MTKQIQHIIRHFKKDTQAILKDNLLAEYLFGSYSKNTYTSHSDIDILIIVKSLNPEIRDKISSLSSDYSLNQGVIISPILKDHETWDKNKKYNTYFYKEIQKYGKEL